MGKLVLFLLGAEAQPVHQFERVAQRIAALELIFDLPEDFPDFIFDRVGAGRALLEAFEIRKQLVIDVGDEIIAGQRSVVVK